MTELEAPVLPVRKVVFRLTKSGFVPSIDGTLEVNVDACGRSVIAVTSANPMTGSTEVVGWRLGASNPCDPGEVVAWLSRPRARQSGKRPR